jgi:hypothetical protein
MKIVLSALLLLSSGTAVLSKTGVRQYGLDAANAGSASAVENADEKGELSTLPAEWIGFAGVRTPEGTLLRWSTSSEHNSAWFKIDCRGVGQTNWQVVDVIPAAGESNTPRFYSWVHSKPPMGALEYRMRQINIYGAEITTGALRIEIGTASSLTLSPCYPNPANAETLVAINTGTEAVGTLVIADLIGRVRQNVFQHQEMLPGSYRIRIDTATLPAGKYILRLTTSEGVFTQRLVIVR